MSETERELARAQRVAFEEILPDDVSWLRNGFRAFLAEGGRLSLERCLRLPSNQRALRISLRDHWLRQAWLAMEGEPTPWRRSERLAVEIQRFRTVKWPRWSKLGAMPADVGAADAALFNAFRSHERIPSSAMQLHNIAARRR